MDDFINALAWRDSWYEKIVGDNFAVVYIAQKNI